jgi:hypothetical protein
MKNLLAFTVILIFALSAASALGEVRVIVLI